jgi:hypothetical protein
MSWVSKQNDAEFSGRGVDMESLSAPVHLVSAPAPLATEWCSDHLSCIGRWCRTSSGEIERGRVILPTAQNAQLNSALR